MFKFWTPPANLEGATLLLVSFKRQDLDQEAIRKRCLSLGPITEHYLIRNGKPIRSYFTTVASGYQVAKRRTASVGTGPIGRSALGQLGSSRQFGSPIR